MNTTKEVAKAKTPFGTITVEHRYVYATSSDYAILIDGEDVHTKLSAEDTMRSLCDYIEISNTK